MMCILEFSLKNKKSTGDGLTCFSYKKSVRPNRRINSTYYKCIYKQCFPARLLTLLVLKQFKIETVTLTTIKIIDL